MEKILGYDDLKAFDARVATENQKCKDLISAFKRVYDNIDADRKVHCIDFPKQLEAYADAKIVHTKQYAALLRRLAKDLDTLRKAYDTCLKHIADVPSNAIGYLPKKNTALQAQIKLGLTKDPK